MLQNILILWKLATTAFNLSLFASFENRTPVFFISAAAYVDLPPGAAHMSNTRSFSWGAQAMTGRNDDAAWIMYCPDRYSGVAPVGVRARTEIRILLQACRKR